MTCRRRVGPRRRAASSRQHLGHTWRPSSLGMSQAPMASCVLPGRWVATDEADGVSESGCRRQHAATSVRCVWAVWAAGCFVRMTGANIRQEEGSWGTWCVVWVDDNAEHDGEGHVGELLAPSLLSEQRFAAWRVGGIAWMTGTRCRVWESDRDA